MSKPSTRTRIARLAFWRYWVWLRDSEKAVEDLNVRLTAQRELTKQFQALTDIHIVESNRRKAHLYDAWSTMKGQTKGLQRQARKIKRLEKQLEEARSQSK